MVISWLSGPRLRAGAVPSDGSAQPSGSPAQERPAPGPTVSIVRVARARRDAGRSQSRTPAFPNVSHARSSPVCIPVLNQETRWALDPWVKLSGAT